MERIKQHKMIANIGNFLVNNERKIFLIIISILILLFFGGYIGYSIATNHQGYYFEELSLESGSEPVYDDNYYDIEIYGREVKDYICTPSVEVFDYRENNHLSFSVRGKEINGTCYLLRKGTISMLINKFNHHILTK